LAKIKFWILLNNLLVTSGKKTDIKEIADIKIALGKNIPRFNEVFSIYFILSLSLEKTFIRHHNKSNASDIGQT